MARAWLRPLTLLLVFACGVVVGWWALGSGPGTSGALPAPRAGGDPSGDRAPAASEVREAGGAGEVPQSTLRGHVLVDPGVSARIMEEFRSLAATEESPPSVSRAALVEAVRYVERELSEERREVEADAAWSVLLYEADRAVLGEIGDPAELLLQARGTRSVSLTSFSGGNRSPSPIDVTSMVVDAQEPSATHAVGGVVPAGQVLVVERVELRALCGSSKGGSGSVRLSVGSGGVGGGMARSSAWGEFGCTLEGRVVLRPFDSTLTLEVRNAVAEARIFARLVAAADAPESTGLVCVTRGAGFLRAGPVVLQVSNPRGKPVSLDVHGHAGGDGPYPARWSPDPVWPGAGSKRALVYAEGVGADPRAELNAYRVEWRALAPGADDPYFEVRVRGRAVVRVAPEAGRVDSGTWNLEQVGDPNGAWAVPIPPSRDGTPSDGIVCRGCVAEAVFVLGERR